MQKITKNSKNAGNRTSNSIENIFLQTDSIKNFIYFKSFLFFERFNYLKELIIKIKLSKRCFLYDNVVTIAGNAVDIRTGKV